MLYSFPMGEVTGDVLFGSVNGTLIGGAQLVRGRRGKALNANGLDQWLDLGNQRDTCMGNLDNCHRGFAMAMWLQMHRYDEPGTDNDDYYITNGGHTDRSMGVALLMREKNIVAYFPTTSKLWEVTYTREPILHIWYHVVLRLTTSAGGQIYINGEFGAGDRQGTVHASNLDGDTFATFLLGSESNSPLGGYGKMTLDELRFWDLRVTKSWVCFIRYWCHINMPLGKSSSIRRTTPLN